jgi:penicillin-binding protein 2
MLDRLPEDPRLHFVPEDQWPPMTPQLARRVGLAGVIAVALFAIVGFRLWYLQVLSGERYLARAGVNRVREIEFAAPRGQILDRSGNVLVTSRAAIAVQVAPPDLPVPLTPSTLTNPPVKDVLLYNRLAWVLGMPTRRRACKVVSYQDSAPVVSTVRMSPIGCAVARQQALLPYANVTIKTDIPRDVLYYLRERQDEFPGVTVQRVWLRSYPLHALAAQLFGTVGPISPQELRQARYRGVSQNAVVGQSGLEYYYDGYLRGENGVDRIQVDALGNFSGYLSQRPGITGDTLRLSLDANLQRAGEQALQQAINSNPPANAGAFVALNPDNGEVYALGSLPSFDPNIFAKPVPASVYRQLNNPASGFPLINRATQSAYPTGSTFKPITATAALESGAWSLSDTYDDTGQFCVPGQCRHNAGKARYGTLDLVDAIKVSSDDFFYNLGALTNADPATHANGGALQHWAHLYGIGQRTGIDLGGETPGNLPSPRWRARVDQLELRCERKRHVAACGIADGRPWSIGDNINLAVGQGDVQVTPLQLAVAYAAIANGGSIVRPHIGLDVESPDGTVLQKLQPPPARHVNINPTYLAAIRAGLRAAASQPGGTSADVFGNFPEQVYGKTGTAQRPPGQVDQSWYACFVPDWATRTPILVTVTVEQGGWGAQAAAPTAREILSQWFFGHRGKFIAGASRTL